MAREDGSSMIILAVGHLSCEANLTPVPSSFLPPCFPPALWTQLCPSGTEQPINKLLSEDSNWGSAELTGLQGWRQQIRSQNLKDAGGSLARGGVAR